jgi:hypothetical protein
MVWISTAPVAFQAFHVSVADWTVRVHPCNVATYFGPISAYVGPISAFRSDFCNSVFSGLVRTLMSGPDRTASAGTIYVVRGWFR